MNENHRKPDMTTLAALLVFTVFAVCVLLVLLTGGDVYKRLVNTRQQTFDNRTCAQYLTTRIRQADRLGAVTTEDFEGCSAVVLWEEIAGKAYTTRVYASEGYLRELFASAKGEFSPEDGQMIMALEAFSASLAGNTLTVTYRLAGCPEETLTLFLRSGREVGS